MHWCLKSVLLYTVAFTSTFLRTTVVIRPVRIPNRVPTCTQTEVEQACSSTARGARYRSSSCLISSAVFCNVSPLQGAKEETSTGRAEWKTANRETDNHQPMESRWWWGITSHTHTHDRGTNWSVYQGHLVLAARKYGHGCEREDARGYIITRMGD